MTSKHRRYMARETFVSVVINALISALFMKLVFGGQTSIDVWGKHGLALDFIPQTFMISAMSTIVSTAIARRRLRALVLSPIKSSTMRGAPKSLWMRVLLVSLGLTAVAGGLGTYLLVAVWASPLAYWQAFVFEVAYGAVVAAFATPISLAMVLSEAPPTTVRANRPRLENVLKSFRPSSHD